MSSDMHMRAIYSEVETQASRGQFRLMDRCVERYIGCPHETDLCITVLTATLPWKAQLPSRATLYSRLVEYLDVQGLDAETVLKGLQ